jgi:hypothetical protein
MIVEPKETGRLALSRYRGKPRRFFTEILGLPPEYYWSAMELINESVVENEKTCVYAGHGVSKTFDAARLALFFLFNYVPSTVITTAPTAYQVKELLWRELASAYFNAKVPLGGHLTQMELDLQVETGLRWFAIGFSTRTDTVTAEATKFQGYHNDHMLLVFDEGAGIMPEIWRAGQHIGAPFKRWLAIGNAVSATGDFAACSKDASWHCLNISVKDTPNFKAGRTVIPGVYGVE